MNIIKILSLLLLIVISSCDKEFKGDIEAVKFIKSIQATPKSDNALRIDINIEFKQSVTYQIEYWKSNDKTSKQITAPTESDISSKSTLILLEAETKYTFKVLAVNEYGSTTSDEYEFTTSSLPLDVPLCSLHINDLEEEISGYILQMKGDIPGYVSIINTRGKVVWYQKMDKAVRVATFDAKTNTISCIIGGNTEQNYAGTDLVVINLIGEVLLHKKFNKFYGHHDIRRMPDGNLIVVNFVPKAFDLRKHGGTQNEIVWGDGYTIFDMKGNIVEAWDCYGELNPIDDPRIMEMLPVQGEDGQKNVFYKDDWLHANSVNFDSEGNIYMSFNWRSELWKIERSTGTVLYRVGKQGNIDISPDGYAEGMHSVEALEPNKVLLLDNGLTSQTTRAMIYSIDEKSKTAKVTLNTVLPINYSSPYMSNVQIINENILVFGLTLSKSIVFTDYKGNILRTLSNSIYSYRSIYIPKIEL